MLGLEFDFETSELRKNLIFKHKIFTGGSANKNLLILHEVLGKSLSSNRRPASRTATE